MKKQLLKMAVAGGALVLAGVCNVNATVALRYSLDGISWTTVADGSGSDMDASAGGINTTFMIGGWNVNFAGGTSAGPAGSPDIDSAISARGTSTAGEKLYVEFSANGFTPVPIGSFITSVFGNLSGGNSGVFSTRVGGNTLFDEPGTTLTTLIGFGTGSGSASQNLALPYSVTLRQVITSGGSATGIVSTDDHVYVPDGGSSLVLLGLSLLGLAGFRRKA